MPGSLKTSSLKSSPKSVKSIVKSLNGSSNQSCISDQSGPERAPGEGSPEGSLGSSGKSKKIIPKRLNSLEEIQKLEEAAAKTRMENQENTDSETEDDRRSSHNVTVLDSVATTNTGTGTESGCDHCTSCGTIPKSTLNRNTLQKSTLEKEEHQKHRRSRANSLRSQHEFETSTKVPSDASSKEAILPNELAHPSAQQIPRKRRMKGAESEQIYKLNMFSWTELSLRRLLWSLGDSIGKYGMLLMIIPLLIFILCTIGLIVKRDQFSYEPMIDSFYIRKSQSAAKFARQVLTPEGRPMFNYSNPAFDAIDRRSNGDFSVIMKVARHGKTILEAENTEAYSALRQRLELLNVASETGETKLHSYADLCRESCGDTLAMLTQSPNSVSMTYPETFIDYVNGTVRRIYLGATFGGVETNPDGGIARARSLAMYYRLQEPKQQTDFGRIRWGGEDYEETEEQLDSPTPVLMQWSDKFNTLLTTAKAEPLFGRLMLSWWSYESFLQTVSEGFESVYFLTIFSGVIFAALVFLACARKDSYSSRPGIAVAIIVVVILSNLGGLSVQFGLSGSFEPSTVTIYYFITAFALLLTLNATFSWQKYNNLAVHPAEKLKFVLSYEAPCLVAACLIAIFAFIVTALVTELDYYKKGCFLMAAIVSLFLLLVTMVFFVALYLTGKREAAGLKWFQFWQKGDEKFPEPTLEGCDRRALDELHSKLCDQEPNMWRQLGSACATVHFRFMTILLVSIYLIFAIWGCTTANIELKEDHLLPLDSMPQQYLNDYRSFYGRNEEYIELIFDDVLDYMNANTRAAIFNLIEWAQKEKYATRAVSWLADFVSFNRTTRYEVRQDTFVAVVNRVFLRSNRYETYAADIAFAPLHTQIMASRMYLQLSSKAKQNPLPLVTGLMDLAKSAELPLRIRAPSIFMLAHDYQIRDSTIIAFAVILSLISFGTLICIAEPFSTLLTLVSCIMTTVGSIGLGSLWDIPFNGPSTLTVLFGLLYTAAVCYTFCYHFINAGPGCKPTQRMEYAFFTAGAPMAWSVLITTVCFLPLLASGVPLITHLAKLLALHLVLSVLQVVFVVGPAMLLMSDQMPRGCDFARNCCAETCCACCDLEEDSASIYYIPTGTVSRSIDHETLQRCLRDSYGDNVHVLEPLSLPAPPQRHAIMPPPSGPVVTDPDGMLVGYSRVVRKPGGGRSVVNSANNSAVNSPVNTRRRRDVDPAYVHRRAADSRVNRDASPAPPTRHESHQRSSRRNSVNLDDNQSIPDETNIYEEPPALPDPNPRTREHRREHNRRDHRYQGGSNGSMDLRPNWRQYMLDGNVRRHAVVEVPAMPMMGIVPGPAPQIISLGPPPQQQFMAAAPPRYRRY